MLPQLFALQRAASIRTKATVATKRWLRDWPQWLAATGLENPNYNTLCRAFGEIGSSAVPTRCSMSPPIS